MFVDFLATSPGMCSKTQDEPIRQNPEGSRDPEKHRGFSPIDVLDSLPDVHQKRTNFEKILEIFSMVPGIQENPRISRLKARGPETRRP